MLIRVEDVPGSVTLVLRPSHTAHFRLQWVSTHGSQAKSRATLPCQKSWTPSSRKITQNHAKSRVNFFIYDFCSWMLLPGAYIGPNVCSWSLHSYMTFFEIHAKSREITRRPASASVGNCTFWWPLQAIRVLPHPNLWARCPSQANLLLWKWVIDIKHITVSGFSVRMGLSFRGCCTSTISPGYIIK